MVNASSGGLTTETVQDWLAAAGVTGGQSTVTLGTSVQTPIAMAWAVATLLMSVLPGAWLLVPAPKVMDTAVGLCDVKIAAEASAPFLPS